MSDLAPYPPYPAHKDRGTALVLVGILEICLGLLCVLMFALVAFAALSASSLPNAQASGLDSRQLLASGSIYLAIAALFGTLGMGTLRGRRWARTIGLVFSWMWLVVGVFSTTVVAFILPKIMAGLGDLEGGAEAATVMPVMLGCMGVFMFLVYIALPGLLVLFYRGPNVRVTFEAKDPSVPWTDRVPTPILGLSLLFAFTALSPLMGLSYRVFPVFGILLTGIPAVLGFLFVGALCAWLAWGIYQRRPVAWWTLLVLTLVGCVNGAFLLMRGAAGIREMYRLMGMTPVQMEQMEKIGIFDLWSNPAILTVMALAWLAWIGFLIWVKRFFTPAPPAAQFPSAS
jgi:hypothetical protein